jgi:uncharacterized membrane protein
VPLDLVLQRGNDIDLAYNGTAAELATVIREYNVSYIYVGSEETDHYFNCIAHFDAIGYLTAFYSNGGTRIYQVDLAKMGT